MRKENKVRKENKKTIIFAGISFVLMLTLFFSLGINTTKLLNNIYNLHEIGTNIDNIEIGDKINYSANGVTDWEVISINKDDNTIEIATETQVDTLRLGSYEDWLNASDKLQAIVDRYAVGDYAISARPLTQNDITSTLKIQGCVWLDEQIAEKTKETNIVKSYDQIYYCQGNYETYARTIGGTLSDWYAVMPIVTLTDSNASNYSVGSEYEYTSHGISAWKVLSINSDASVSIMPVSKNYIDLATDDRIKNINQYINSYLNEFYDHDNVTNVRLINISDANNLVMAGFTDGGYITGFNGIYNASSYNEGWTGYNYPVEYEYYRGSYLYPNNGIYRESTYNYILYYNQVTQGVIPVVTLKYNSSLTDNKNKLTTDIKIGDKVIYEGNGYTNWKVLSINESDNTAEIVSSNIVELLKLKGINDYNNYESIYQEVIDKYLDGDIAISARLLSSSDFEKLTIIKDTVSNIYWLSDKAVYKYSLGLYEYEKEDIYGVAVASYDKSQYGIIRKWSTLEAKMENNDFFSIKPVGSYDYTAGIRPVIKVKLESLKEATDETEENIDDIAVPENENKALSDEEVNKNKVKAKDSKKEESSKEESSKEDSLDEKQNVKDKSNDIEEIDIAKENKNSSNTVAWIIALGICTSSSSVISYQIGKNTKDKKKKKDNKGKKEKK